MVKTLRSLLCLLTLPLCLRAGDFALHDGDTVAFLGDSITAARGYTKIVEHYTLLRYPERKVRFFNAGVGGDTAAGALKRLEHDVFSQGATVVTVAFGINDIGWGMKANDESKRLYLESLRAIIEQCRAHHVRPIICSPAITAEAPDKAEAGFLQRMADESLAQARELGVETVDLQRGMREIQRRIVSANEKEKDPKKATRLHLEDGVHPNDLGQLAMAFALLKGLGAPEEVSAAELDAEAGTVVQESGCHLTEVQRTAQGLTFTRTDAGLPMTHGGLGVLAFRWVPVPDGLDRYTLTVRHLPAGEYQLFAEGRLLGKANADRLAHGLNLALQRNDPFQPGGPWDAQSLTVRELVETHDRLAQALTGEARDLAGHPRHEELRTALRQQEEALVALQRQTARPYPYHFEIRLLEPAH